MLRAASLKAMRKKKDERALKVPLRLGRAHELVDDALRGVGKVAKLGLPHHERRLRVEGIAELKPKHGEL